MAISTFENLDVVLRMVCEKIESGKNITKLWQAIKFKPRRINWEKQIGKAEWVEDFKKIFGGGGGEETDKRVGEESVPTLQCVAGGSDLDKLNRHRVDWDKTSVWNNEEW